MKKLISMLVLLVVISACDSTKDQKILKQATGRINEILIVIKNSEWQGSIGDELRKIIAEPVLGLPQPEAQFSVSQFPPENFGSMFRASRSVLAVGLGEENSFEVRTNVYSSPQKIITIKGTDEKALIEEIKKNRLTIISEFKKADLKTVQRAMTKKFWDPSQIETFKKLGFSIKIPRTYNKVDDTGDFLWYRYHLNKGNSMELIAYTVPLNSEDDEQGNTIVENRNAIGEKYIPGAIEGSHMITEEAYAPHVFEVELNGKKAFESRGKWEIKGVYMAGPFLNYTVVDKANNRLVVVEGFTYAPSIKKRDYMFELEAILTTLQIK